MGHTHEDIDQLFSRISKQLSQKGAETIPGKKVFVHKMARNITIIILIILDLQDQIFASSTPSPKVSVLDNIRDVKSWIEPCLESFRGHSSPHCFKFIRDTDNKVVMYYRNWSMDPWCDNDEAIDILKVC